MAGEQRNSETVVWRPIKELEQTMDEMEQTYEEVMGRPFFPLAWSRVPKTRAWTPPVEVMDKEDSIVIRLEVPGAVKDSIDIAATRNSVTIRGELNASLEPQPKNYYLCERCYGPFSRTLDFTAAIEPEKIQATLDQGVLTLTVPKSAESIRKKIRITGGAMGEPVGQGMQGRPYGQEPASRRITPAEPAAGERPGQTPRQPPATWEGSGMHHLGTSRLQEQRNIEQIPENAELSQETFKYEQTGGSTFTGEMSGGELPGQTGEVGEENRSGNIRVITPRTRSRGTQGNR